MQTIADTKVTTDQIFTLQQIFEKSWELVLLACS